MNERQTNWEKTGEIKTKFLFQSVPGSLLMIYRGKAWLDVR